MVPPGRGKPHNRVAAGKNRNNRELRRLLPPVKVLYKPSRGFRLARGGRLSSTVSITKHSPNIQASAMTEQNSDYIELAADIVSAYVSNNTIAPSDLPALIQDVHGALLRIHAPPVAPVPEPPKPAVNARRSVHDDYIICLEDGKKFKSLKRHLRTQYNMTPEQYREKWSLPPDYPMVAPNYAKARSALAKEMGLGQTRKKAAR